MGPFRLHIGGGEPVAWGTKGKSAAAPQWLKDAWKRGMARMMTAEQVAAENKRLRELQQSQVAGPGAGTGPAAPRVETLRTRPVEPTANLFTGAAPAETDEERDNRRSRALSHMPGLPTPKTEWQMRGGEFGARARRERGVFRAPAEEAEAGEDRARAAAKFGWTLETRFMRRA
jgi:hypothetical protein